MPPSQALEQVETMMGINKMLCMLLMPVSKFCCWALCNGLHFACCSSLSIRPVLERRRHLLTTSQAAVARVLPTGVLWCGVAEMAAAALALLLGASGDRRGRLALAYAALAARAANHCLCARLFALMLVADTDAGSLDLPLAIICTAGIVFFAAQELAGFRSLGKAAAAAEPEEAAGRKDQ